MSIFRRVLATFRKRKLEDEIAEEMRYHVEARTELNMEKGQNADEAHASALRQFGNATQQREAALQADMAAWAESLGKDLRYAARTLRRNRLFTIFAVLTMAMGIGATTLMFSVV